MSLHNNNVTNKLFLSLLLLGGTVHVTADQEEQTEQHVVVQSQEMDELNNLLDNPVPLEQSNPSNPASYTPAWVKSAALRVLSGYLVAREKMVELLKNVKVYIAKK